MSVKACAQADVAVAYAFICRARNKIVGLTAEVAERTYEHRASAQALDGTPHTGAPPDQANSVVAIACSSVGLAREDKCRAGDDRRAGPDE